MAHFLTATDIGVFAARRHALQKHGLRVPDAVAVKLEVDTGSYKTGIDRRIFEALELRGEVDVEEIYTPSTGGDPHPAPVYLADLTLVGDDRNRTFANLYMLACTVAGNAEGRGIVGRDILNQCRFVYDGPAWMFRLSSERTGTTGTETAWGVFRWRRVSGPGRGHGSGPFAPWLSLPSDATARISCGKFDSLVKSHELV